MISANTHGPASFAGPGSLDVKIEGKNVHLLGDPMLNNCGASGSPANAATLMGVIQASGMVTAVEEGQCPICEKSHGELKETKQTKTDAGSLAAAFKGQIAAATAKGQAMDPPVKVSANTMLGVVECKCGKRYADQSGATTIELCNAASMAGMKHMSGATVSYVDEKAALEAAYNDTLNRVKVGMAKHLGNSSVFQDAWDEAENRAAHSNRNRTGPAAYPPGACAAQGALLLLMNDGALPAAMTEQWFSSGGSKTQASIEYIDNQTGVRQVKLEKFKPGQTVPPCKACELLVPLLICDGGKPACEHKI